MCIAQYGTECIWSYVAVMKSNKILDKVVGADDQKVIELLKVHT